MKTAVLVIAFAGCAGILLVTPIFLNNYKWRIREQAYRDAVADVQAYHQCFPSPEVLKQTDSSVWRLIGGNWPTADYMREASHFIDHRDCNLVVTIDNYAVGNKP